jgi:hypothetical protein
MTRPQEPAIFDVNELWDSILHREWRCLGVISVDSWGKTWGVAQSLASLGNRNGRIVTAVDAFDADLSRAASIAQQVCEAPVQRNARWVIALDAPLDNPRAIGVLASCDAAVLVLEMGVTSIPRAQRAIEAIGREQLLGAVVVRGR